MGGGGGSSSSSLGDTRHLEARAKEILQQGDTGRKNVFISFAYEDLNDACHRLRLSLALLTRLFRRAPRRLRSAPWPEHPGT
jgi:hypothetical protein